MDLRRGLTVSPGAEAIAAVGEAARLKQTGRLREAAAAYEALLDGVARPQEVHLNRAVIFTDCLRQDEPAERELMAALALDLMGIGNYNRKHQRLMALCGETLPEFSYDILVREPRRAAQRLLTFCGLDWEEGCLEFAQGLGSVKTASVWQVRTPLYQHSSGRAAHYAGELAELTAYLTSPS